MISFNIFHEVSSLSIQTFSSTFFLQEAYKSRELHCRCHGVSGSCTLKICSEKLPRNFRKIGSSLYKKYQRAKFQIPDQAVIEETARKIIKERIIRRKALYTRRRRWHIKKNENLEFYDFSPDFCKLSTHSKGIKNRVCLPYITAEEYQKGKRSCDELCCYGRGVRKVEKIIQKNCVFKYCCNVECDEEKVIVDEYYCL